MRCLVRRTKSQLVSSTWGKLEKVLGIGGLFFRARDPSRERRYGNGSRAASDRAIRKTA